MGRYTSDDNRSMQLNPENERYWSSRGYDDDDYDDEVISFNQEAWEKKREVEFQKSKDLIDSGSINIFGKKVIFMEKLHNHSNLRHPAAKYSISTLFEKVLKEEKSAKKFGFAEKSQRGLTVNFSSFKQFIEKNSYDLGYLKRILEEKHFVSDDVKRNYIYFNNVYVSKSYMIFQIDPRSQGRVIGGMWDNNWSWMFSHHSCHVKDVRPKVIYENFKDVFTCKKYLIDL